MTQDIQATSPLCPHFKDLLNFSAQRWSQMFFALEELLVVRSGLLCVRRKQLERAIYTRYIKFFWLVLISIR